MAYFSNEKHHQQHINSFPTDQMPFLSPYLAQPTATALEDEPWTNDVKTSVKNRFSTVSTVLQHEACLFLRSQHVKRRFLG